MWPLSALITPQAGFDEEALAELADCHFQHGDYETAAGTYQMLSLKAPDNILYRLKQMQIAMRMQDNLACMRNFKPLSDDEQAVIREAQEAIGKIEHIPCTACRYCTDSCPQGIPIPDIFTARNKQLVWGQLEQGAKQYAGLAEKGNVADACIGCGQCESACPQGIDVIDRLAECAKNFKA